MAHPKLLNAIMGIKTCDPDEVFSGKSGNEWIKGLADKLRCSQIIHDTSYYSSKSIEEIIKQALLEGNLTEKEIKVLRTFWKPSEEDQKIYLEKKAQKTTEAALSVICDNGNIHATAARVSSERTL